MKKLMLKENRVTYDTGWEQALRDGEAVLVEHEGRAIAAVVPMEEYEAFRAWKAKQQPEPMPLWREDQTLEEIVAEIKRRGPGVPNVREATASLAELLAKVPSDPSFDLKEWERDWAKVEAEIEEEDHREP